MSGARELLILLLMCILCFNGHFVAGRTFTTLTRRDSLSASTNDLLVSASGKFALGFFPDFEDKIYLGVWFTGGNSYLNRSKVVWIANRLNPGENSSHADWDGQGFFTLYTTKGKSTYTEAWKVNNFASTNGELLNNGNFVLYNNLRVNATSPVFESFSSPSDTLLPGQIFRPGQMLSSWLSSEFKLPLRNPAPGSYSLNFQLDGNLALWARQLVNYWSSETPNENGKATNFASLDELGSFTVVNIRGPVSFYNKSLTLQASGAIPSVAGPLRRLTLDPDGNLRMYMQTDWGWTAHWAAVKNPDCIPDMNLNVAMDCNNGAPAPATASPPDSTSKPSWLQSTNGLLIVVSCVSIIGTAIVLATMALCWFLIRRSSLSRPKPTSKGTTLDSLESAKRKSSGFNKAIITNSIFEQFPGGSPQSFTFAEIQAATRNFRKILGSGAFGKVYKGKLPDNRLIAVKKLEKSQQGQQQFQTEVLTLGSVSHPNLVHLHGYCSDEHHQMLVYEFVANRSLERFIFSEKHDKVLDWPTRLHIAIGTAKGLRQCHELQGGRPRIIHCDVKPENILLDADFSVKVSDFGLAKLMGIDKSWTRTHLRGTRGYLAPEWISGRVVTVKVDVYSFGIVLLEIVTGSRCCDKARTDSEFLMWVYNEVRSGKVAHVVDTKLGSYDEKEILMAIRCGLWCVQVKEHLRPSMHMVVEMLEGKSSVPIPPPPRLVDAIADDFARSSRAPRPELKQRS